MGEPNCCGRSVIMPTAGSCSGICQDSSTISVDVELKRLMAIKFTTGLFLEVGNHAFIASMMKSTEVNSSSIQPFLTSVVSMTICLPSRHFLCRIIALTRLGRDFKAGRASFSGIGSTTKHWLLTRSDIRDILEPKAVLRNDLPY